MSPIQTMFKHTIYSVHLEEERLIKVYLPEYSEGNKPLSILYCQDGSEFFMYGRIATIAKELQRSGQVAPLLIVGVNNNMRYRSEEYMAGGVRNEAFVKFFLQEALPFVEREYRAVLPEHAPPVRHLAGVSLGAAVSLQLALLAPQQFHKLLLFSGAFYRQLAPLLEQNLTVLPAQIYLYAGAAEAAVTTSQGTLDLLADHRWLQDQLQSNRITFTAVTKPGNHTWRFWQRELPGALRWLAPASQS